MTEKQVYARLYRHLGDIFAPLGFTLLCDEERHATRFVRSIGDVTQSIDIPLNKYGSMFRFSLLFEFRSDEAERLYHLFSEVQPKYQALSATCMVLAEALTSEINQQGIEVSTVAEIQERMARLALVLGRDVFPFLNEHHDVAGLDRLMNGEERDLCHHVMEPHPSMHAVIIAYLAGRSDLSHIITSRRKQLEQLQWLGEKQRTLYDQLVEYLKQHARSQ